jgi:hypothetical protein
MTDRSMFLSLGLTAAPTGSTGTWDAGGVTARWRPSAPLRETARPTVDDRRLTRWVLWTYLAMLATVAVLWVRACR